jgi:hypothetical protein
MKKSVTLWKGSDMEITCKHYAQYAEIKCVDGRTQIETGFLNKEEQKEFAINLLDVAEDLVDQEFEEQIYKIRVKLSGDE